MYATRLISRVRFAATEIRIRLAMTFARIKLLLLLTKSTTCRPPRILFQMLDPLAFIQLLRNIHRSDDVRNIHNFCTSVDSFSYGWSRATSFDHRAVQLVSQLGSLKEEWKSLESYEARRCC